MNGDYLVKDINLASVGQKKIDWVSRHMPVLNGLAEKFKHDGSFNGRRISVCIHLEAKTAYLALIMQELGARVWITGSNVWSTKDDVCAALAKKGIHVYATHGATAEEFASYIHEISVIKAHAVVDDGGDVCDYLHRHPEYGTELKGICEETTTGVMRLKEKAKNGKLLFPALAINDARSKYLFDNRYGTGQSTWTAIMHLTNLTIAGKTVVCVGYGWVGRGVAMRAAGLGAEVIIVETDPWKALEARMDGFKVMSLKQACPLGDFIIGNTGLANSIGKEHFPLLKNGAFLANTGHFDHEIDIAALKELAVSVSEVRDEIDEYVLGNDKRIYLLSKGGIVNIAGGLGHPAEIMDMSFSLQLSGIHYLLKNEQLKKNVYAVPEEIDELVVREKLRVDGIEWE